MAHQTAAALTGHTDVKVVVAYRSDVEMSYKERLLGGSCSIVLPPDDEAALQVLRTKLFDVIHLFDFVDEAFMEIALTLSQELNVPLFVTPATEYSLWENPSLGIKVLRQAKGVFALTLTEANRLQELAVDHALPIELLPHAAVLSHTEYNFRDACNIPDEAPLVLFLGRKMESKGYPLILEAAEDIWTYYPNAYFAFLGPDYDISAEVLVAYRDEPRIISRGMVTEKEKAAALSACDLLCLPSLIDVFPVVFLEAWMCKKPVVASKMPGIEEVIFDGIDGLIAEPTAEGVAIAIRQLLDHEVSRKQMGENGWMRVQNAHSWEAVAKQLSKRYRQI
ncbi:MAG: glycosyltransferase family 4 protein [Paenibacillus sp.]|jgi:glycosyltransferase involved in cell wall biosynthesis|nr:glycosyltransferase family 4 protein [Paenibacillus sp.]